MEQFLVWFLYRASLRTRNIGRNQFPNKRDRVFIRHTGRRFREQVDNWWNKLLDAQKG